MKHQLFLFILSLCLFLALNSSRYVLAGFDDLPPEVTEIILNELTSEELAKMSLMNKMLNAQASERFNELYSELRHPDETRSYFELSAEEQIFFKKNIDNFRALERLGRIQSLEGDEIQDLLNRKTVLVPFLLQMFYKQNLQAIGNWISDRGGNFDKNSTYFASFAASNRILSHGAHTAKLNAERFLPSSRFPIQGFNFIASDAASERSAWFSAIHATPESGWGEFAQHAFSMAEMGVLWRRTKPRWSSQNSVLTKLGLKTDLEFKNAALDLAELVTLRKIVKNGPSNFLFSFELVYENLDGSLKAQAVRKKLMPLFGKEEFLQNPFMQSLDTFLVQLEELLGICIPKDAGKNFKRCRLM